MEPGQQHYGLYGGGNADIGAAVPADAHIWLKSASSNRSSCCLRLPAWSMTELGHHPRAARQLRRQSRLNATENTHMMPADIMI